MQTIQAQLKHGNACAKGGDLQAPNVMRSTSQLTTNTLIGLSWIAPYQVVLECGVAQRPLATHLCHFQHQVRGIASWD